MLRKSLAIACLLILNTSSAAWSLDRSQKKRSNIVVPTASSVNRLQEKLLEALETERYSEVERLAGQILRQDPSNRTAISYLGLALKEQSKFTQAESLYRQQISKNQLDFPTYRELGAVLEAQDKLDAAVTVYRQAIALNPANSYLDLYEINQSLVEVLIRLNRIDEAVTFGRQRLAVSTNEIEILTLGSRLSGLFQQQGNVDESIAVLRQIIAKAPSDLTVMTVYTQLGQLLIEQGKESEAIDLYQQAIAQPKSRLGGFAGFNSIYLALGRLLEKQNRLPEALVVYRKSIANSRAEVSQFISRPELLKQLIDHADTMPDESGNINLTFDYFPILGAQIKINEIIYKQQGWTAVQQEMKPISQTTPEIAAYVLRSFGNQRSATKHYSDAILAYQQAIQLDQNASDVQTQSNLFLAWTLTDRPQQAQAAYQKALTLTPAAKQQESIKNWALALDKAGRKTAAIELYRQFLKSPGKDYLFISLQLFHALTQSGQTTEANIIDRQIQVTLTKLQRTAPQDPKTFTMQGNFFNQHQQRQEAIDSYRKAIGLLVKQGDKKDGRLLSFSQLKLAENLRLTGKHPEAIELYRQAIQGCNCTAIRLYEPSTLHGMAYHGMGLSLEVQGQLVAAKAAFQKAVDLDSNYEEAQNSLKRINGKPIK
jgi:tetratricopeptide (TPR) repeat protein